MRVLSLFDGCAGARQALTTLGINCEYYASETDSYAQRVALTRHPDIHSLGDINGVEFAALGQIDLVIGGSPCRDLTINKRDRAGLSGTQSRLFYKYLEAVETLKPKYFLLENVASMRNEDRDTISSLLGVQPVRINSQLLTAQLRDRLYWCNWSVTQPTDKGVLLRDILEHGWTDRKKSLCLDANYQKGASPEHYFKKSVRQLIFKTSGHLTPWNPHGRWYARHDRIRINGVTQDVMYRDNGSRLLTPVECERLQGLPDLYSAGCSKAQRYKMLGNGFTIPVISHILSQRPV